MDDIGIGERDLQIKAVIKSNIVCGDLSKIDELVDNLYKDILDVLSHFESKDGEE